MGFRGLQQLRCSPFFKPCTMDNMQRIVRMDPSWDKRSDDPTKNYGIRGVNMIMVLKGELGAVQFVLFTGWFLPKLKEELGATLSTHYPMPADLGYHSPTPVYDEHTCSSANCEYLDGKPCYYDGSTLNAEPIYQTLLEEGSEGVWKKLEAYYNEIFKVR